MGDDRVRVAALRTALGSTIRSDNATDGSVAREGRARMSIRVLVVEDDPAIVELITYNLEGEGFSVSVAETGEEAQMLVNEAPFDLILLDWMLPGVSGIELCRRLRQRNETTGVPIIMLTARGEEGDRVRGLATGADDYIVKPFSVAELIARVKAMLRRASPERVADVISVGDVTLDRLAHRVKRSAREVRLGPTEYRLLEFMMERAGRVLSREQILDGVWGRQAELDERTVDVHIGRLRKALVRGKEGEVIRTVRGAGYVIEQG
jgi:two-component system phosphate regulon response regulator PhoB